jgi:hypothetical protein
VAAISWRSLSRYYSDVHQPPKLAHPAIHLKGVAALVEIGYCCRNQIVLTGGDREHRQFHTT